MHGQSQVVDKIKGVEFEYDFLFNVWLTVL